jgi:transglutaminase-like putative cysteine protease
MRPESDNLRDFLASTEIIDWANVEVSAKAGELTRGFTKDIEKARRLFEWVRDEIPHSGDIDSDLVTCTASEVLQTGTGICFAKSHLLAALLRATGIPAGFCYQVLTRDPPFTGLVLHGLNGMYLREIDRWIRVDSRGNTGSCDAQFDIYREKLAFAMNAADGEFIYDTIFHQPARVVVEILAKYDNRTEMWPHLPRRLPQEKATQGT